MANETEIKWLTDPEDHDYPAAASYLSLLYDEPVAAKCVEQLRKAPHVEIQGERHFPSVRFVFDGYQQFPWGTRPRDKVVAGQSLSPLLLVRATNNERVVIADGYLRMCAVYSFDEDALIPCKIV